MFIQGEGTPESDGDMPLRIAGSHKEQGHRVLLLTRGCAWRGLNI